jgi:hypothetical protein
MRVARQDRHKSRRGAPWSPAELKSIGKAPDSLLARRSRRTIKEIVAMREFLGRVLAKERQRRWTRREIQLLGTMKDYAVALRLRRGKKAVRMRRIALRIGLEWERSKWRFWEPSETKLLGTMSDHDLAARLGRKIGSVRNKRIQLHILMPNYSRRWKPEHLELLGKVSDAELGQLTGRSVQAVRAMRWLHTTVRLPRGRGRGRPYRLPEAWTEEEKALLKKLRNPEVAAQVGCSIKSIQHARQEFRMRQPRLARL